MSARPNVALLLVTVSLALPASALTEQERLEAHFVSVLSELRAADLRHLDEEQWQARGEIIAELERYAARARFPINDGFPASPLPAFIDGRGTRCAMAHLIESSGAGAFVQRVAREENHAYIADLAERPELVSWLDVHGLSLQEAARIQPSYAYEAPLASILCGPFNGIDDPQRLEHLLVAQVTVHEAVPSDQPVLEVELSIDEVLGGTPPHCGANDLSSFRGTTLSIHSQGQVGPGEEHTVVLVGETAADGCHHGLLGVLPPDQMWSTDTAGHGWNIWFDEPVKVSQEALIEALSAPNGVACMATLATFDPELMCSLQTYSSGGRLEAYPTGEYECGNAYDAGVADEAPGGSDDDDGAAPTEPLPFSCSSAQGTGLAVWLVLFALIALVSRGRTRMTR